MSDTIVDMPKVCQMLDNGWKVDLYKGGMGTYFCMASRPGKKGSKRELVMTDDFTPEQALTRLAYKVCGEII